MNTSWFALFFEPTNGGRHNRRIFIGLALFSIAYWGMRDWMDAASDSYYTPARGSHAFKWYWISMCLSTAVFYILLWSAVIRHLRCWEFLLIARREVEGANARIGKQLCEEKTLGSLAAHTAAVTETILYPFGLLVILLVARHSIFDAFNFPNSILIFAAVTLTLLLSCAVMVSTEAARLKAAVLGKIERDWKEARDRIQVAAKGTRAESSARQDFRATQSLKSYVQELRQGAFGDWKQLPVSQAVLLALGGVSVGYLEGFFKLLGVG